MCSSPHMHVLQALLQRSNASTLKRFPQRDSKSNLFVRCSTNTKQLVTDPLQHFSFTIPTGISKTHKSSHGEIAIASYNPTQARSHCLRSLIDLHNYPSFLHNRLLLLLLLIVRFFLSDKGLVVAMISSPLRQQ